MADILDIILKAILTSAAGAFVGAVIVWVKGMLKRQKEFERPSSFERFNIKENASLR